MRRDDRHSLQIAGIPCTARPPGIWRYAAHLPLSDTAQAVSLGEGGTPLLRSAWLGAELGLPELHLKVEGANPTGSYKDRIAAVGIARLRELGKRAWAATILGQRRRCNRRLWRARRTGRLPVYA